MNLTRGENYGLLDPMIERTQSATLKASGSVYWQPTNTFSLSEKSEGTYKVFAQNLDKTSSRIALEVSGKKKTLEQVVFTQLTEYYSNVGEIEGKDKSVVGKKVQDSQETTIVSKINEALAKGIKPLFNNLATSKVYNFRDARRNLIGIFKPTDDSAQSRTTGREKLQTKKVCRSLSYDAQYSKNELGRLNSNQVKDKAPRNGLYSDEICYREVAAYLLDERHLHGVPPTSLVKINETAFQTNSTPKNDFLHEYVSSAEVSDTNEKAFDHQSNFVIGSLQKFMSNNGASCNINFSKFPIKEVQKIALLDLRILNSDRNEANILFKRSVDNQIQLIPIDHSLSMPDKLEIYQSDLCWLNWPQAKEPIDPELYDLIMNMNPVEDVKFLNQKLKIRKECLFNFRIAETVLKIGVMKKLTLFKIASMVYRSNPMFKSQLEKVVESSQLYLDRMMKISMIRNTEKQASLAGIKKNLYTPQKESGFKDAKNLKHVLSEFGNSLEGDECHKIIFPMKRFYSEFSEKPSVSGLNMELNLDEHDCSELNQSVKLQNESTNINQINTTLKNNDFSLNEEDNLNPIELTKTTFNQNEENNKLEKHLSFIESNPSTLKPKEAKYHEKTSTQIEMIPLTLKQKDGGIKNRVSFPMFVSQTKFDQKMPSIFHDENHNLNPENSIDQNFAIGEKSKITTDRVYQSLQNPKTLRKNTFYQVESERVKTVQRSNTLEKPDSDVRKVPFNFLRMGDKKKDDKKITEMFFKIFEQNVEKMMDEVISKIPRKYTFDQTNSFFQF